MKHIISATVLLALSSFAFSSNAAEGIEQKKKSNLLAIMHTGE